jgi:folylpolyglutamate synthase/dihydropteroate synthase
MACIERSAAPESVRARRLTWHNQPLVVPMARTTRRHQDLVAELAAVIEGREPQLLFGVMRKDWEPMVEAIAPAVSDVTVTTVLPHAAPRLTHWHRRFPATARSASRHALAALKALLSSVTDRESILVTGSLFLVGAIYPYFLQQYGKQDVFSRESAALLP